MKKPAKKKKPATRPKAKKKKRRVGRPSKIESTEILDKVFHAVRIGAPYELAALYAGLDRSQIWRWIQRGEKEGKGPYFQFRNKLKESEGEAVVGALSTIHTNSAGQWQAAAWLLERRYPADFGRLPTTIKVGGDPDNPIKHEHEVMTPEEQAETIASLISCGGLTGDRLRLPLPVPKNGNGSKKN